MAMNGFEKLLKAMGIDPTALAQQFGGQLDDVVGKVRGEFDTLHDRMASLEASVKNIETLLMNAFPEYLPDHLRAALDPAPPDEGPADNVTFNEHQVTLSGPGPFDIPQPPAPLPAVMEAQPHV